MTEAVKTALMAVMAALLGWSGITTISLLVSVASLGVEIQLMKERLSEQSYILKEYTNEDQHGNTTKR